MKRSLSTAAFALLTALCAFAVLAGPSVARAGVLAPPVNPEIVVVIEGPKGDVAGITAIQGFAFSKIGIDRVEWVLDGTPMGNLPHGGSRGDVPPVYPSYPKTEAENSGFSSTWFMGLLTPGDHEIIVSAYDTNGGVNSDSVNFTSYKFAHFIKQDDMKMQGFAVRDVRIKEGSPYLYDVEFEWSQAGQTWEISKITEVCDDNDGFPCATLLIQAPTNVQAQSTGTGLAIFIEVTWLNASVGAFGTEIQRREIFGQIVGNWETVGYAQSGYEFFSDFGASTLGGNVYEYRVRGFDGAGPGAWSQTVVIPAPAPGPIFP